MRKEIFFGPTIIIVFWYLLYFTKFINPLFLPPPHSVIIKLFQLLSLSTVWREIGYTIFRTILGFIISALIGIPTGLIMGYYEKLHAAFDFLVDFFRSLPAIALFPLFMFFFGIGDSAKIATAVFTCSLIVIINSIYGVTSAKKTRQIVAHLMGANSKEIFRKVILMDALPQIFVGLRTSLSFAVIVIVATEMFIGNYGIGRRIYDAQLTYRVSEMYSYIIFAGLLGYGLNKGFVFVERKIIHWSGK